MGGAGNALLQYIYLNLYIGSHLSKKRHKEGLDGVNWELTEMAKILTDNWQIAENLTDYWHLPWILLATDKGPDCPLFSTKPIFKELNSIVPLFLSDKVIKCAFLGVILAARRLRFLFR